MFSKRSFVLIFFQKLQGLQVTPVHENPCKTPINPCKHLQCSIFRKTNRGKFERDFKKSSTPMSYVNLKSLVVTFFSGCRASQLRFFKIAIKTMGKISLYIKNVEVMSFRWDEIVAN